MPGLWEQVQYPSVFLTLMASQPVLLWAKAEKAMAMNNSAKMSEQECHVPSIFLFRGDEYVLEGRQKRVYASPSPAPDAEGGANQSQGKGSASSNSKESKGDKNKKQAIMSPGILVSEVSASSTGRREHGYCSVPEEKGEKKDTKSASNC
ncbi:hypothetical protein LZ31DRAFT_554589 [Colletotrichum somersetense]|nr:hypothetical protein LZ31DRAFT_554589 [Colletotrichum somersetense]